MIRVLIGDDHALIREGFKKILKMETDIDVSGEAANAAEVLSLVEQHAFDVVVLDISMPGRSGIEIISDIKRLNPKLAVLILSMHPEQRFAIRSLKAGADGYITKDSAMEELVKAIRKVVDGRKYISQELAEEIAMDIGGLRSEKLLHERLSEREYEVFILLGSGKNVSDIAKQLSLSISTVNTYRYRIMDKMHIRSNADLIRYAVKNDLVD